MTRPGTPTSQVRRVCLVSGGGDAPGVNAILRGFVHAAHRRSIEVVGSRYGFEGLLSANGLGPFGLEDVSGILPKGGCVLGCSTRINPFFMKGKDGKIVDASGSIVDRLRSLGVDRLVLVGGDGTTLAAMRFAERGLGCVCIPKTIDNDLGHSERTCGFESAVETVTHAIDALHSTAEAHARVMIVEVMGRNAGCIALHAGVAGGADVVLVPEVPYRLEHVVAKIREREALGRRFSIVVVAEGARPVAGPVLEVEAGAPGRLPRLGGAGERLLHELEGANLGHEVRLTVLGHLQRGGSPSASDRILGTEMGVFAAELCHAGARDVCVAIRGGRITQIPLPAPTEARLHRQVDLEGTTAHAARLVGIELGDGSGIAGTPTPVGPGHCRTGEWRSS